VWFYVNVTLTLSEEHRWRAFENRVLKRIIGPRKHEVTGSWRKLHNLYSLSSMNDHAKEDEMGGECSTKRQEEECIWDIGGKARRKETTNKIKM
jgi:hypothetical protein